MYEILDIHPFIYIRSYTSVHFRRYQLAQIALTPKYHGHGCVKWRMFNGALLPSCVAMVVDKLDACSNCFPRGKGASPG
jgi:hypothetical protein